MEPKEALALLYDWDGLWQRESQMEPVEISNGSKSIWVVKAGRGYGKTRVGAEWIRKRVKTGKYSRITLVGETAADARDTMIEGESGLLAVTPPDDRPRYLKSQRKLEWPNGAIGLVFSADDPEQLRGPQSEIFWADEIGKWRYGVESWDNLMFGFRLGDCPQGIATTTPRNTPLIKSLMDDPTVVVTNGSTYENKANLAQTFITKIIRKYEGTRLGKQELLGEMLDDNPNALWSRNQIDALRVIRVPDLKQIVVAVDPAVSNTSESDEAGIIVVGKGVDDHGYVLADLSIQDSVHIWGNRAVEAYRQYTADRLVAEINNGGDLVEALIRSIDSKVVYRAVRASRGKIVRAEPVAMLYEQGKFHHLGTMPELEDELCTFSPNSGFSPNRLDALVWGAFDLFLRDEDQDDETAAVW